eukprot:scaffold3202_cov407-Prasinococcus_capsulatus_cf.AAC.3
MIWKSFTNTGPDPLPSSPCIVLFGMPTDKKHGQHMHQRARPDPSPGTITRREETSDPYHMV